MEAIEDTVEDDGHVMSEHVIEVTDLRRSYRGGSEAVRGITFSVGRGEILALLGTNGAGKTSTVELLEGLAPPSGGRVRVLGRDPYRERAAVRPRTGVMLQEGGFPSELTVAGVHAVVVPLLRGDRGAGDRAAGGRAGPGAGGGLADDDGRRPRGALRGDRLPGAGPG
ncbi:ATP-binding cassette domain-containing protein, partial [Streptomyces sp. NPDC048279]|uniref:ATP-binding cassette domain-containing protein n=1 Tax=Streptomyces sp. NPDC048279 TaxID=3154714 RepID=UPI00343559C4